MLFNSWTLALLASAAFALLLLGNALRTAIRVIFFWNTDKDTNRQISLENETWLAAHLVRFGMGLQLVSLLLLIFAADSYAHLLPGAMCAAGAFAANPYGMPALLVKIAGVFFYGFWLVLHHLDGRSEYLPLTRIKFFYLLTLVPLFACDLTLLALYLFNLHPDIITSCCGVIFSTRGGDGFNLVAEMSPVSSLTTFFCFAFFLLFWGWRLKRQLTRATKNPFPRLFSITFAFFCLLFFLYALLVITAVISPFIYDLPNHRCPFDILDMQYFGIGYPLYVSLFLAIFCGISSGLTILFANRPGLADPVHSFRRICLKIFFISLLFFLLLSAVFPLVRLLRLDA